MAEKADQDPGKGIRINTPETDENMKKPEISPRFDVDDIRKIRNYNSWRHSQMTHEEIIEDIRSGASEVLKEIETLRRASPAATSAGIENSGKER